MRINNPRVLGLYYKDIPNKKEEARIFKEMDKTQIGYSSPWRNEDNEPYLIFTKENNWNKIFTPYLDKLFNAD